MYYNVMEKLDFKRKFHELYTPPADRVVEVTVPKLPFLMMDGQGDPNAPAFHAAVQALYTLSYTLKFWAKKHPAPAGWQDYGVAPLEARWWVEGVDGPFAANAKREDWRWTAMIMQPHFITAELVEQARDEAQIKKPEVDLGQVRLEEYEEGRCIQLLHVGSYSEEMPNILKLVAYSKEHGLASNGRHHEIYLGDPMRVAPDKLKTILRHPVRLAA